MKANVPKPPRPWERLPSSQRKAIEEYALEMLRQQEDKDMRIMLDLYTKMTVCVLHDGHEMDEDELICFLGNHKRLFQRHARMVREGTQLDYFNKRMAEIFPTSGFPQQFFDDMLGAVEEPVFDEQATAKVSRSDLTESAREAIKQFAERLKPKVDCEYGDKFYRDKCFEEIDNLVKEMTEGNEEL